MTGSPWVAPASGIYGLFRLDGGPIDEKDATKLGLDVAGPESHVAAGRDARAPETVHRAESGRELTILVGQLDGVHALASSLAEPPSTPPALLARAALARFGSDTPAIVTGEWSLLHWAGPGRLTLMNSAALRDRIFYSVSGPRIAVSPDLFRLSSLSWGAGQIDEEGLLFGLARGALRGAVGERTMLGGVRQLEPGCSVTFSTEGIRRARSQPFTPQPRWPGSFADAMHAAEELLRAVLRERLERTRSPAVMLSGGLDSSTLACFAAGERSRQQPLLLFTSVAPPESGLSDEAAFADTVADQLGLRSEHIWPERDANIYRPPDFILASAGGPPLPTRHCLTESFQRAARARSATVLLDGTWGELTFSGLAPNYPRHLGAEAAAWLRKITARGPSSNAFHVRLAPRKVAALPDAVESHLERGPVEAQHESRSDLWGYHRGAIRAMRHANQFYGGAVRADFPYRDLRILRLFAGFPAEFMRRGRLDRAPARTITLGRLPESVRLRKVGGAASPDHLERMRRQAPAARDRIAEFRKAGVDEWLDLDWLDGALLRIARRAPRSYEESNLVQLTAITAEFLTWWR